MNTVPRIDRRATADLTAQATVLTDELVQRLNTVNLAIRWLRSRGHKARSLHLQGRMPMIQVDASAASVLKAECSGCNWTIAAEGMRIFSVIYEGCAITWYERVGNNNQTKMEGAKDGEQKALV